MESGGVRYIFTHSLFLYDELSEISLVQQLVRKYRTKHFPCGILFTVFILFILGHSSFCQPLSSNLSRILIKNVKIFLYTPCNDKENEVT